MKKYISLLIVLSSCIYPFDLSEDQPEKVLVVEGYISNRLKDSEIKLSYSNKFKIMVFEKVTNALVEVLENNSTSHKFIEKEPGYYIPSDSFFVANPNSVYKLHIVIDNKVYESSEVKIKKSAVIQSLDFEAIDKYLSGDNLKYRALNILITNFEDPDASKYHRYAVEETWLVTSRDTFDLKIRPLFIYNDAGDIIDVEWNIESNIQMTYCWASSKSKIMVPTSTEGLVKNQLVKVPIFNISIENTKFLYKYSALVKQYSIPVETHYFLKMMNEFSENDFTLFDTQPGYVEGNISCLTDEKEKVIGVFYASDVVEQRMFILHKQLSPEDRFIVQSHQLYCPEESISVPNSDEADKTPSLTFLRDSLLLGKGYVVANILFSGEYDIAQTSFEYCSDCRVLGTNVKPDFWGALME